VSEPKTCRQCGGIGRHYDGCRSRQKLEAPPSGGWGVFPHAEWVHTENGGRVQETGRGFVARPIEGHYVPYMRMTPVRVFKRKSDADKLADKLTFGSEGDLRSRITKPVRMQKRWSDEKRLRGDLDELVAKRELDQIEPWLRKLEARLSRRAAEGEDLISLRVLGAEVEMALRKVRPRGLVLRRRKAQMTADVRRAMSRIGGWEARMRRKSGRDQAGRCGKCKHPKKPRALRDARRGRSSWPTRSGPTINGVRYCVCPDQEFRSVTYDPEAEGDQVRSRDVSRLSANDVERLFREGRLSRKDVIAWCRLSAKKSGRVYVPKFQSSPRFPGGARVWLQRREDLENKLYAKRAGFWKGLRDRRSRVSRRKGRRK
jgi:hypothetical protein